MKLADLKSSGAFVPLAPVATELTWKRKDADDLTFTVFIKKHSFGTIEKIWGDKDDERSKSAALIAHSVLLGDDGKEKMSYEDAFQLDPGLAGVFIEAINQANGLTEKEKN